MPKGVTRKSEAEAMAHEVDKRMARNREERRNWRLDRRAELGYGEYGDDQDDE